MESSIADAAAWPGTSGRVSWDRVDGSCPVRQVALPRLRSVETRVLDMSLVVMLETWGSGDLFDEPTTGGNQHSRAIFCSPEPGAAA